MKNASGNSRQGDNQQAMKGRKTEGKKTRTKVPENRIVVYAQTQEPLHGIKDADDFTRHRKESIPKCIARKEVKGKVDNV